MSEWGVACWKYVNEGGGCDLQDASNGTNARYNCDAKAIVTRRLGCVVNTALN